MGAFAASALATVERTTGKRIVEHFDLLTGPSTGGVLAIDTEAPGRHALGLFAASGFRQSGHMSSGEPPLVRTRSGRAEWSAPRRGFPRCPEESRPTPPNAANSRTSDVAGPMMNPG
ncbi:MAG: hypothetical protein JO284_09260 [Planctomycetaceae bacterium]|nr:hypothetical protein [Planctomycetaceae bacterium]MBV8314407.1 hypothetical protein [Planctomycetaceae bacterium]